jgi:4-hydroxyphenylpyruvate dioxygenase
MFQSISSLSFSGGIEEKIIAAAEAGFDGIEVFREDIIGLDGPVEDIAALAGKQGIEIVGLQSLRDFEAGPEAEQAWSLKRAERFLDLAVSIGAPMLVVCANTRSDSIDDPDRAAADLALLADMAQSRGLRIGYEALATSKWVRNAADAWAIVKKADRPNLGLVIGAVHCFVTGADLSFLDEINPAKIFLVHLADAPTTKIDKQLLTKSFRLFPGQGNLPISGFCSKLVERGYKGPFSMETFSDEIRALPPVAIAADGIRSFQLLDEAIRNGAPPSSVVREINFVEFTAKGDDAAELKRMLKAMGFTCTHKGKKNDVELFRQGDIRIVVNEAETGIAHSTYLLQGLSVNALALRVDDLTKIDQRMNLFQHGKVTTEAGANIFDLPCLRGPGGSVFYLLDLPLEETPNFNSIFKPVADAALTRDLLHIDHFAQAIQPSLFLSALLFYRASFGFKSEEQRDVLDPHGTVHSRTLSNDSGLVRMSINYSIGAGTTTRRFLAKHGAAPYHHFAFSCPDIFAYAETLDPDTVLQIPPHYYDDLLLRFDIEPETLNRLRKFNILYDRDANGYTGLGAANAPVRNLAQSHEYERNLMHLF